MTAAQTKRKINTSIQKAVHLERVPEARFETMVQKTVLGVFLAGLGVYLIMPKAEGVPLYVGVGLVVLGATVWSGQLVTGAIKALVGPLRSILGKGDDA